MFRKIKNNCENIMVKDINPPIEIVNAINLDDEEKLTTASSQVEFSLKLLYPVVNYL